MCFSIIIPVYNAELYLRECLDSVLVQEIADWEAICVDDGSTDGSLSILREYESRDRRFRVCAQTNGGPGRARNAGLAMAQGQWIVFLDSDDRYKSDYLATFKRGIERAGGKVDFLCVGIDGAGWSRFEYQDTDVLDLQDGKSAEKYRLCHKCFSPSRCVRRALLQEHGIRFPEDFSYSEDVAFHWLVMFHARSFLLCSGMHYLYRSHAGSLSDRKHDIAMLEIAKEHFKIWCCKMSSRLNLSEAYSRRIAVITYYVILREMVEIAFDSSQGEKANCLLEELFENRKTMRWFVHDDGSMARKLIRYVLSRMPLCAIRLWYKYLPDSLRFH